MRGFSCHEKLSTTVCLRMNCVTYFPDGPWILFLFGPFFLWDIFGSIFFEPARPRSFVEKNGLLFMDLKLGFRQEELYVERGVILFMLGIFWRSNAGEKFAFQNRLFCNISYCGSFRSIDWLSKVRKDRVILSSVDRSIDLLVWNYLITELERRKIFLQIVFLTSQARTLMNAIFFYHVLHPEL